MQEYEIIIKRKLTDNDLYSIFYGIYCSSYEWTDFIYSSDKFEEVAKSFLKSGKDKYEIHTSDVLFCMLKNGDSIIFVNGSDEKIILTLDILLKAIEKHLSSFYFTYAYSDISDWECEDYERIIDFVSEIQKD